MGPSIIMEKGFLEIDREKELLVILVKELKDGGVWIYLIRRHRLVKRVIN